MRYVLLTLLAAILVLTFIEPPAPAQIDIGIYALLVLLGTYSLLSISTLMKNGYILLDTKQWLLVLAMVFYAAFFIVSGCLGYWHGASIAKVIRSVAPYLIFFVFLIPALAKTPIVKIQDVFYILIAVGLIQVCYHHYLYFFVGNYHRNVLTVEALFSGRMTSIDGRTTEPLLLATAILPLLNFALDNKNKIVKIISFAIMLLSFFAAMETLVRSMIMAILLGWISFSLLFIYKQTWVERQRIGMASIKMMQFFLLMVVAIFALRIIPWIAVLEDAPIARNTVLLYNAPQLPYAGSEPSLQYLNSYATGRLDEWGAAFQTWRTSGKVGAIFGIGSGVPFKVSGGVSRTYVHNLLLYSLLYQGLLGLFSTVFFYIMLFLNLIQSGLARKERIYLAFASLLAGLFLYALFFAVHKLLAYNAMLLLTASTVFIAPKAVADATKGT
jgi:O-antigen ligase